LGRDSSGEAGGARADDEQIANRHRSIIPMTNDGPTEVGPYCSSV
jgi:hypothetical protein